MHNDDLNFSSCRGENKGPLDHHNACLIVYVYLLSWITHFSIWCIIFPENGHQHYHFIIYFSVFLCLDSGDIDVINVTLNLNFRHNLPARIDFTTIVKLSYFFPFALLRFKKTWKLLMWFHYWPLLWWKRLRLLFKQSQNALIHTDELKSFICHTTYMCIQWEASWPQINGVQIHVKVDCC